MPARKVLSALLLLPLCFSAFACQRRQTTFDLVSENKSIDRTGVWTITDVERYENGRDCEMNLKRFGGAAPGLACHEGDTRWDALFRKQAAGQWYMGYRPSHFAPHIVVIEHAPATSDYLMQLRVRLAAESMLQRAKNFGIAVDIWAFSPAGKIQVERAGQVSFAPLGVNDIAGLSLDGGAAKIQFRVDGTASCANLTDAVAEFIQRTAVKHTTARQLDMLFYLGDTYLGLLSENNLSQVRKLNKRAATALGLEYFPQVSELATPDRAQAACVAS